MLTTIFLSLVISLFLSNFFLKFLKKKKILQSIREDGPTQHHVKAGTPTMGGIAIILTINFAAILFLDKLTNEVIILLTLFTATGFIGFLDDYLIVKHGKNHGLPWRFKLLGQFIIAALFCIYLISNNFHNLVSPLLHFIGMNNPILYVLLSSFIIIGSTNAVNLTDGLDGLVSGILFLIFLGFAFIANQFDNYQLTILAVISAISCLGFLYFNKKPAKIFMGDTGSLALGTLIAGFALLLHAELYLFFLGFILVIETLSVIIQVLYYKKTKKRIFKMAPIHHHFELSGWSENSIVHASWLITAIILGLTVLLRLR